MAVGDRLSNGTYKKENKRRFHDLGNNIVKKSINRLFNTELKDIMSGYRVCNKIFVKNMPVLSKGFEIETEMTLYALDKGFRIYEIPIQYRDRQIGSNSKLNTIKDGMSVIKKIVSMYKNYRPRKFFFWIAFFFIIFGLIVRNTSNCRIYKNTLYNKITISSISNRSSTIRNYYCTMWGDFRHNC